jgi:hypothetical protein
MRSESLTAREIRMHVLDPAPPDLWDRVCARCPYATFFHTRLWAEAMVAAFPELRIATRAYLFEGGTVAILPLVQYRAGLRGLFRSYESMFPGVYGGIIADGELSQEQVWAIYASMRGPRLVRMRVFGNPYAPWGIPATFRPTVLFTQALRLSGEFKDIWRQFSRGNRSNIRKAVRSGLQVTLAETESDYAQYYAAYQEALRRWGERATSRYPLAVFRALSRYDAQRVRLWLVRKSGAVIGGILVLYHNRHAVYWHGAFVAAFFEYRPSNLVHAEAIRDACERGYEWYDFNPSGGHAGVVRFKHSFHPQLLYFHAAEIEGSPLARWYAKGRERLRAFIGGRGGGFG